MLPQVSIYSLVTRNLIYYLYRIDYLVSLVAESQAVEPITLLNLVLLDLSVGCKRGWDRKTLGGDKMFSSSLTFYF